MKKLGYVLIALVLLVIPFAASAKEKVNVYLFRGEGCPHCEEALEFFDALSEDEEYKDLYSLVTYEVWYDSENQELMKNVADALNKEVSGVPFIVIGSETFSGYAASMDGKIKTTIKEAYESDDYKDIVKEVSKGTYTPEKYKFPVIPVAIVAGVVILAVIGLVIFTGEKEEVEEVKPEVKEVKEEKKTTNTKTKKSTTKKTTKK
jgi:glutaredoxin